jgi:hypothetical protein
MSTLYNQKDINILRELAKKVAEISLKEIQEERRELWRKHNNLEYVRPPIYIRSGGWQDELFKPELECKDSFLSRTREYSTTDDFPGYYRG